MDQIEFFLFSSETIRLVQHLLTNYYIVRFNKLFLYDGIDGVDLNGS